MHVRARDVLSNKMGIGIALLLLAQGLASCSPSPQAPSTVPQPSAFRLADFIEDATGFTTSDLHDAQEQVLQFSTIGELIWSDGSRLPGYRVWKHDFGYYIEGKICTEGCVFVVRFGAKDGERRAYLTVDYGHDNPGTLVDVEVASGALVVTQTSVYPPGAPTLSGIVTEMTRKGPIPVEGATVYRGVQTGWRTTTTDKNGFYRIPGLFDGNELIDVRKENVYKRYERQVIIDGDTRFDVQLERPNESNAF